MTFNSKRIISRLVVAIILCVSAFTAGAQELRNESYVAVGRIAANGTVRNSDYKTIGYFDADGTVRNANYAQLGRIADHQVYNASNVRIGYFNSENGYIEVRDGESKVLGRVDAGGTVRNATLEIIGYAKGVLADRAACYFFFHMFG